MAPQSHHVSHKALQVVRDRWAAAECQTPLPLPHSVALTMLATKLLNAAAFTFPVKLRLLLAIHWLNSLLLRISARCRGVWAGGVCAETQTIEDLSRRWAGGMLGACLLSPWPSVGIIADVLGKRQFSAMHACMQFPLTQNLWGPQYLPMHAT